MQLIAVGADAVGSIAFKAAETKVLVAQAAMHKNSRPLG
jgi:hypothetical protein